MLREVLGQLGEALGASRRLIVNDQLDIKGIVCPDARHCLRRQRRQGEVRCVQQRVAFARHHSSFRWQG